MNAIELKEQTEEDKEYNETCDVVDEKLIGAAAVKAEPTDPQTANPFDALTENLAPTTIDPSSHEVKIETETVPMEDTLNSVERIKIFLKNTAITIFFSILLPTVDVLTDLRLIIFLYFLAPDRFEKENGEECSYRDFYYSDNGCIPKGWMSHWKFGTALLIPFLANYFLSWLTWARLEKDKRGSWWLPALNIYPQYRAARVVTMFWTKPARATEKKAKFEREISLGEVFIESVPTTLVMTAILPLLLENRATDNITRYSLMGPPGSYEFFLFFITFGISVLSASLGLAKCLKIGVCRTMGEGGPAGGLLSGKFLLAMIASAAFLVLKGWMIAQSFVGNINISDISKTPYTQNLLVTFCLAFFPQFLLAVFSVVDFRSANSLKIFYRQPSLLLLPTFTCFTFSRISSGCRGKANNKVKFSKIMTIMNMTVTALGTLVWPVYHFNQQHESHRNKYFFLRLWGWLLRRGYGHAYADTFGIPMILLCLGLLATFLFLFNDKMSNYCCNCWSTPQKEVAVYNPEEPETHIVLNNRSSQNN